MIDLIGGSMRNHAHCSKIISGPLLLMGFVLFWTPRMTRLNAQESQDPARTVNSLIESEAHVVFDATAFGPGTPMPHWDHGYLVSMNSEIFAPGSSNVRLSDKSGAMVRSATVWFPGSERVSLTSAAVGPQGEIIASGEADEADGTRARFIASVGASGKMTAIQTGAFDPDLVCAAPNGTIWSLGSTGWDGTIHHPKPGETFRNFDMQRGQISAYIPRSTFPDKPEPYALSYIRCDANEVVAYSPYANLYIEMPYGADRPRIYKASMPTDYRLIGFAIQGPKQVFGLLQKYVNYNVDDSGLNGLYSLVYDEKDMTVQWVPLAGAVGSYKTSVLPTRLWGVDGSDLVLSHSKDIAAPGSLHWDSVTKP
ncbi:MAG: hypothetical protein WBE43_00610 [Candidatus Acidiferrales bacterium]